MNRLPGVIFAPLFTAVLILAGCTSSTSTRECETDQDCTPPKACIDHRCVGGSDDDGGLDAGDGGSDAGDSGADQSGADGGDGPVIDEGTEVLRAAWGSGEGQLGHDENIPEGPMSFVVDDSEQIYILDQINSRVQVYRDGSHQRAIPVPAGYYFQDIDLSQSGNVILLDRLLKKSIVFLDSNGGIASEVVLPGDIFPDPTTITGLYSREDGVWVGDSSRLVRIADPNGTPDPDRPSVPGLFSQDGSLLLSAEKDGELTVVLYIRQAAQPDSVSTHVIRFDIPVMGIEALESDSSGRIDLGVHVYLRTGDPENVQIESYVFMVILNDDQSELRRFRMPVPTEEEELRRSIRVISNCSIFQMRFDADGAIVTRYEP